MPVARQKTGSVWPARVSWPREAGGRSPIAAVPALVHAHPVRPYVGRSRFVLSPLSLTLDQLLFLITAALLCFGLVMVQSADARVRAMAAGGNWWMEAFDSKNAIHALVAMIAMTVMWRIDYRWLAGSPMKHLSLLRSPATWLWILTVGALVAVLTTPMGKEINFARRWLQVGPLGFQPSELAKLSLILFVAVYAVHYRDEVRTFGLAAVPFILFVVGLGVFAIKPHMVESIHFFSAAQDGATRLLLVKTGVCAGCLIAGFSLWWLGYSPKQWTWGYVPLVLGFGVCAALVLKEDFGTAALISVVVIVMILMAGCRWWHVAMLIPPGVFVVWAAIFRDPTSFRYKRMMAFLDPFADMKGAGYHPAESLLTIASGGFFGNGLGNGIQKMGYLPEDDTDFIFAVICEELGFFGALMVIGLFLAFVIIGWRIATRCQHQFGKMVAFGITAMIGLQAAFNIAVVTVTVPTKGIALPLISSGGTGWIMNAIAIGVLMSIERINRREIAEKKMGERPAEPALGFPVQVTAVAPVAAVAAAAVPVVPAEPIAASSASAA
ncbi:MAG: FtsW/RodA/SpoVE family cell cycle protein [Phycisphaerae bacterium]